MLRFWVKNLKGRCNIRIWDVFVRVVLGTFRLVLVMWKERVLSLAGIMLDWFLVNLGFGLGRSDGLMG